MFKQLAEQYAEAQGSSLLRYRVENELHVILLADGRKFKLTNVELEEAISTSNKQIKKQKSSKKGE